MRILHVNKFLYRRGGAEAYMLDVAQGQRALGHDVEFFAMQHPQNLPARFESAFPTQAEFDPAPDSRIDQIKLFGRMVHSSSSRKGIESVLQDFEPDVVHLHNVYHQLSPSILGPIESAGIPTLMTLHDYKLLCPTYTFLDGSGNRCTACIGGDFRNAVRRRCAGSVAASAAAASESALHRRLGSYGPVTRFLAPSHFLADKFREADVYADRLHVLHNFVDTATVPVREQFSRQIAYVGRLSAEKGIDLLIRAMSLLPPDVELVIGGDGPDAAELQKLAAEVAPGRVSFLGRLPREQVLQVIAASGAAVVPSRWYENGPISVLEALGCGVPVVASQLGGLPEFVKPGVTGELVEPDSAEKLAAGIESVLSDPAANLQMGRNGRRLMVEEFNQDCHIAELDRHYTEIVAKQLPGAQKKLKIAMIGQRGIPATYGGVERHVERVSQALAAQGHDVTVFCRSGYCADKRAEYDGVRPRYVRSVDTKHLEALTHSIASAIVAAREDFDVVHFHAVGPGIASWIPQLASNARIIQTIHGLDADRSKWSSKAQKLLSAATRMSTFMPDETVVVSNALAEHYAEKYRRITTVIPNGVDEAVPRLPDLITSKYGLTGGDYLLFVGRLVPEKAPEDLVRAMARVPHDIKLVIAGGASHTEKYVSMLRSLGRRDDRVIFAGYVHGAELEELYTNAAAFILPSRLEGLPLTLLEAASYGTPVIASDIPPHTEVLRRSAPGHILFPTGDVDSLAAAICFTLEDPEASRQGAVALRGHVASNYSWEKCVADLEDLYGRVCSTYPSDEDAGSFVAPVLIDLSKENDRGTPSTHAERSLRDSLIPRGRDGHHDRLSDSDDDAPDAVGFSSNGRGHR